MIKDHQFHVVITLHLSKGNIQEPSEHIYYQEECSDRQRTLQLHLKTVTLNPLPTPVVKLAEKIVQV